MPIVESDIDKLATAGVTRGCNPPVNDRFCPGSNVTRGQMAAFLRRALGQRQIGTDQNEGLQALLSKVTGATNVIVPVAVDLIGLGG